jgi:hypothetical protein
MTNTTLLKDTQENRVPKDKTLLFACRDMVEVKEKYGI